MQKYGSLTLATWAQNIAHNIPVRVYSEDPLHTISAPTRFTRYAMPTWQQDFALVYNDIDYAIGRDRRRNKKNCEYDFRQDAVRFSHKTAAIIDTLEDVGGGYVVWIDCDVSCKGTVDTDWLMKFINPPDHLVYWLHRQRLYPECGFVVFNTAHDCIQNLIHDWSSLYVTRSLFKMSELHDSFVLQQLVKSYSTHYQRSMAVSISGNASRHHSVFLHSPLRERLHHWKGALKNAVR